MASGARAKEVIKFAMKIIVMRRRGLTWNGEDCARAGCTREFACSAAMLSERAYVGKSVGERTRAWRSRTVGTRAHHAISRGTRRVSSLAVEPIDIPVGSEEVRARAKRPALYCFPSPASLSNSAPSRACPKDQFWIEIHNLFKLIF